MNCFVCAAILRLHFQGAPVDPGLVVKQAIFRVNRTGEQVSSEMKVAECPHHDNLLANQTEVSSYECCAVHSGSFV
jgi:hypothetical protein